MRALLRMLGVGLLGLGAALLVACGDTKGLLAPSDADALKSDLDQVAASVADGKCQQAGSALQRARDDFDALPSDVDPGVRSKLAAGLANLADKVPGECADNATKTQTAPTDTTPTDTTPTDTTPTDTTPTDTTPTDTTPTDTTPTDTTPAPTTPSVPPGSGGQTAPATP